MSGVDGLGGISPTFIGKLTDQIVQSGEKIEDTSGRMSDGYVKYRSFAEQGFDGPVIAALHEDLAQNETAHDLVDIDLIRDRKAEAVLETIENHWKYFQGLFNSRDVFNLEPFQENVHTIIGSMQDLLNASLASQYLFGGSMTDRPPVDVSVLPDPHTYALNDTDLATIPVYYKGDNNPLRGEEGDAESLLASDKALQNMFKVLNLFKGLDETMGARYQAELVEIERLLPGVTQGITSLRTQQAYIEGRHRSEKDFLTTEKAAASTELATLAQGNPAEFFMKIQAESMRQRALMGVAGKVLHNQETLTALATGVGAA